MKIIHSTILALAIGVASITGAQAHDSFSFGINVGAPPVAFYNPPIVYYSDLPRYYSYPPVVSYQYYDDGRRDYRRGWGNEWHEHHGWGHEEHEHHGWGHGRREHDGWNHGGWDNDDDD